MSRFLLTIILLALALSVLSSLQVLPPALDALAGHLLSLAWSAAVLCFLLYLLAPGMFRGFDQDMRHLVSRVRHDRRELEELHRKVDHLDKSHHMVQLGHIYLQQGRHRKATAWLERALEKEPDSLDAQYKLGLCYFAQGKHVDAARLLERVYADKPNYDYGTANLRLAQCHHKLGNLPRAAEAYGTLLQQNPGHPEGAYHYALLREEQGDRGGAAKLMTTVVHSVRHSPRFHRRRNRHLLWKARWWLWRRGSA
jgi:tetratricopeptide (TPR) repeat protein